MKTYGRSTSSDALSGAFAFVFVLFHPSTSELTRAGKRRASDAAASGAALGLDRLFDSRQSDSTAFLNGGSSFCDAAQEFRVMLKAIVEPVVLRCKPDKDACRPPVTRDDDLFVDG